MTTSLDLFNLQPPSVREVIGPSAREVMVYGFHATKYSKVIDALSEPVHAIQRIFDYSIGSKENRPSHNDSPIEMIPTGGTPFDCQFNKRCCKMGISTLVLENFKRKLRGDPIIPLIFCTELIGRKRTFLANERQVLSKISFFNNKVTHSELRRAFKHCADLRSAPDSIGRQLEEVAQETFKFVRVEYLSGNLHRLIKIPPLWERPSWQVSWEKRRQSDSTSDRAAANPDKNNWRKELLTRARLAAKTAGRTTVPVQRTHSLQSSS